MTARRVTFQHHGIQSFRSRIDGGRQARRSGTDDREIAFDLILVPQRERPQQTGDLRHFAERGPTQRQRRSA